jgi:hypothetical protein
LRRFANIGKGLRASAHNAVKDRRMTLLFLELNEVNFDQLRAYAGRGKLPNLAKLIERHGVSETSSEARYEELEPWIQWVSAHTGMPLAEHGVYRLGDIVGRDLEQIWEVLERQGVRVGAISPMNAENRCVDAAFFVPDPWTPTAISGPSALRRLYAPIAQAVNDNAEARLTMSTAAGLIAGLLRYAAPANYPGYAGDVIGAARRRVWRKAMMLDRLLADVFVREVKRTQPGFATLFLNAAAHIQHHYLFNSSVYEGALSNPGWYIRPGIDPVFEIYQLYDRVVGQVQQAFPEARLMLATGLHQDPHGQVTLYWRLRDHVGFLERAGVPFQRIEPRMSRDFVVFCRDADEAARAADRFSRIISVDGQPLFSVDNRGDSLFVELTWAGEIGPDFVYLIDGAEVSGLSGDVAFVAVKNGQHNGIGYFLDTAANAGEAQFPITEIPARICQALGVEWTGGHGKLSEPLAAE